MSVLSLILGEIYQLRDLDKWEWCNISQTLMKEVPISEHGDVSWSKTHSTMRVSSRRKSSNCSFFSGQGRTESAAEQKVEPSRNAPGWITSLPILSQKHCATTFDQRRVRRIHCLITGKIGCLLLEQSRNVCANNVRSPSTIQAAEWWVEWSLSVCRRRHH